MLVFNVSAAGNAPPPERPGPGWLKTVGVFCSSRMLNDPAFAHAAKELGTQLAQAGYTVVYGGGNAGLMGIVAQAAIEAGGEVIGVTIQSLDAAQGTSPEGVRLVVAKDIDERMKIISEKIDASVCLPGGFGTGEEFYRMGVQIDLAKVNNAPTIKPIILANIKECYGNFIQHLKNSVSIGAISPDRMESIFCYKTIPKIMTALRDLNSKPARTPADLKTKHAEAVGPQPPTA